jgi:hypothetical protein
MRILCILKKNIKNIVQYLDDGMHLSLWHEMMFAKLKIVNMFD